MRDHAFASLNHPEPELAGYDKDGKEVFVQLYSVHEVIPDIKADYGVRYEPRADNLTWIEVNDYIKENEYDA